VGGPPPPEQKGRAPLWLPGILCIYLSRTRVSPHHAGRLRVTLRIWGAGGFGEEWNRESLQASVDEQ
jgi:hypothetical protein